MRRDAVDIENSGAVYIFHGGHAVLLPDAFYLRESLRDMHIQSESAFLRDLSDLLKEIIAAGVGSVGCEHSEKKIAVTPCINVVKALVHPS